MPLLIAFFLSNLIFQILFFLLQSEWPWQRSTGSLPVSLHWHIRVSKLLRHSLGEGGFVLLTIAPASASSSSNPEAGRTAEKSIAKAELSLTPSPANSYISKNIFIYFLFSA